MTMPLPPIRHPRTSRPALAILATLAILALLTLAACGSTAASSPRALADGSSAAANSAGHSTAGSTHTPAPTSASAHAPGKPSSTPGATAPTPAPTRAGLPPAQPTPIPTRPPAPGPFPTATPFPPDYCAPYLGNQWGFNFNCGLQPVLPGEVGMPSAQQFCAFFTCNANFYRYNGFAVQCVLDNTFTRSDGFKSDTNTCPNGGTRRGLLVYHPPA